MEFIFNDGGRSKYFKGQSSDCVVRAIAIVLNKPYIEVYDSLNKIISENKTTKTRNNSSRTGISRKFYDEYLINNNMVFIPCMAIGSGCKVHLKKDELPQGRIIARLSRHLTAVIDGVIYDTYNPSRDETRCVYGYYKTID